MLASSFQFIAFLVLLWPCARMRIDENSDFSLEKCIFSKVAQKRQFGTRNQIELQNLKKHSQKSLIFEFDFKSRTWFQKNIQNHRDRQIAERWDCGSRIGSLLVERIITERWDARWAIGFLKRERERETKRDNESESESESERERERERDKESHIEVAIGRSLGDT